MNKIHSISLALSTDLVEPDLVEINDFVKSCTILATMELAYKIEVRNKLEVLGFQKSQLDRYIELLTPILDLLEPFQYHEEWWEQWYSLVSPESYDEFNTRCPYCGYPQVLILSADISSGVEIGGDGWVLDTDVDTQNEKFFCGNKDLYVLNEPDQEFCGKAIPESAVYNNPPKYVEPPEKYRNFIKNLEALKALTR